MTLPEIVRQALQDRYLTPSMEAEVRQICESASELSPEEYSALDRLMEALLKGEVAALLGRRRFVNLMEELVIAEAHALTAAREVRGDQNFNLDDIAAYALNRLPPLYATTVEGADYQRQRAREELQGLVCQYVEEGIQRFLHRPESLGRPLEESRSLLEQLSLLLNPSPPPPSSLGIPSESPAKPLG